MLAVRLDADLEARLTAVAKSTGLSKSQILRDAIENRIGEFEEIAQLEVAIRDPEFRRQIALGGVEQFKGRALESEFKSD